MKTYVRTISVALLASVWLLALVQSATAQATSPTTGACGQQPCPTASCGSGPCPQNSGQSSISNGGKRYTPPPPKTEGEKARIEQQGRYDDLFAQAKK